MSMRVKFWGVRGSIACPSLGHLKYGGNTSCIEVSIDGELPIILDCGTGIHTLGHKFVARGQKSTNILMSHTHWDHINGFPFFAPIFRQDSEIRIYAGHLHARGGIKQILADHLEQPLFPVPLELMASTKHFNDFVAGESFTIGNDVAVRTAKLNHPGGATGYRLEKDGASVCYVTDTEHTPGRPDENILALIEGADLVIYDSTYTDAEFPKFVGWGHSTWQEGVRLCQAANARQLAIFHHDPSHDDSFMVELEAEARRVWNGTLVAREQLVVSVG
ncbi:MAG: MBL fold metallo-hydrolase [Proteobacteria bacterium]|nr:MBL fold metallo-hydrolase [Pseudomonadota bacterium]MDA1132385.1 MBL fold metallo-hydrolase [Pseudomonadota bacterium]